MKPMLIIILMVATLPAYASMSAKQQSIPTPGGAIKSDYQEEVLKILDEKETKKPKVKVNIKKPTKLKPVGFIGSIA